jgi:hypothetical protein
MNCAEEMNRRAAAANGGEDNCSGRQGRRRQKFPKRLHICSSARGTGRPSPQAASPAGLAGCHSHGPSALAEWTCNLPVALTLLIFK